MCGTISQAVTRTHDLYEQTVRSGIGRPCDSCHKWLADCATRPYQRPADGEAEAGAAVLANLVVAVQVDIRNHDFESNVLSTG